MSEKNGSKEITGDKFPELLILLSKIKTNPRK
jgi:hypothetical protein